MKSTPNEKPIFKRLAEKRAQLESDSAMMKTAPEPTPGAIQTHPMEAATEGMTDAKVSMEQCRQVMEKQYNAIEKALKTGDFSEFLDQSLAKNPEAWETKAREYQAVLKKLLTILPLK